MWKYLIIWRASDPCIPEKSKERSSSCAARVGAQGKDTEGLQEKEERED